MERVGLQYAALFRSITHDRVKIAAFAYLDCYGVVVGLRHCISDNALSIELPLRRIASDALALGASHLVMAHNHPSGDAEPSSADLSTTRRIALALDTIGVRLIDHLILAGELIISMRERGIL